MTPSIVYERPTPSYSPLPPTSIRSRVPRGELHPALVRFHADSQGRDWLYTPVIDGTFIQDRPEALLAQGKVNGDRVWITHNFNEVRFLVRPERRTSLTAPSLQGLVGGGAPGDVRSTFTPQDIGNSTTAQRSWLSSILPNLDNASLTAVQDAYTAETFGSLQVATDLM